MANVKKITWSEMTDEFRVFNKENEVTTKGSGKELKGVVVFDPKKSGWKTKEGGYTLEECSYIVSSDNKAFISGMSSNSIFAHCMDGIDLGVRLDWYMQEWAVDYCYLLEE